jgi:integrase
VRYLTHNIKNMVQKHKNTGEYSLSRDKFFTRQEQAAILRTCDDLAIADRQKGRTTWITRRLLVRLALYSGLRVAEIAALRICDCQVNVPDPFIRVSKGKGGRPRDVYIDRDLTRDIRQHQGKAPDPDAPLFAGRSGAHYTPTALHISFKQAIKKAGLRSDLTIHSARHTYATNLYDKTEDLRLVQKQLGHSTLTMTSLYADIAPEKMSSLANKILD